MCRSSSILESLKVENKRVLEFLMAAILRNPWILEFASESWRADFELLLAVIMKYQRPGRFLAKEVRITILTVRTLLS